MNPATLATRGEDQRTIADPPSGSVALSDRVPASTSNHLWLRFAAVVVILRAIIGVIVWKRLLFIQAEEDLGRYWWFARLFRTKLWEGDNPGFLIEQFSWVKFSPWLPLHHFFLERFMVFGDAHAAVVCAVQTLIHAAATLLVARTAWHLSGGRWPSAIPAAAGMFAVLRLNIIGTGFLTEPIFYLCLTGMALGAVLLGRGPGSPWLLAGFWAAVAGGEALRYECWLFAGASILVIAALRHGTEWMGFLRTAFLFGLGTLVVPALWLALNQHIAGDALHFLKQTQEHFGLNVTEEVRGNFVLQLWSGQQPATIIVFALALCGLWRGSAPVRVVSGLATFLALMITGLNAKGMGGFSFPERYWIAAYVVAVPAAATVLLQLLEQRFSVDRRVIGSVCAVVLAVAFIRLLTVEGFLSQRWDYPAMRAAISIVRADPAATQKTLLWMDNDRLGWHQILPNLQIPGRWETLPITADDPVLRRDSAMGPRVVLMNVGKVKWRDSAGAIPPPIVTPNMPWEIYLFTSKPNERPPPRAAFTPR